MSQKKKTVLDGLNLVDKFLFDKTIENKEAFEAIASIVTSDSIVLKEAPHVEKEEGVSPELRAIRLDVVGFSEVEQVLSLEMQQRNTYNIPKRSRLYQGMMDVSLLEPGETDFNKLNNSCMVFIAPFDIFGRGLYRYTFEGVCRECPDLKLNDGALRIFINTKGKNRDAFTQEFLDFCDYVTESTDEVANRSKSEKVKLIHEFVSKIRMSEKMGVKYMQRWEELAYAKAEGRQQGIEQGMEQGIEQGFLRHIYQMVERGKYSIQDALEDLQGTINESEFVKGMLASGYKLP
ncbi:MAG: Rpn family recombination-promoting nuclease/putative transposase [Lachnospiraceae bacterium]|nr:Rpn family recombination-promoting nuclease/putative transposase [Lachnospiraceae bacterium]